MASIYRFYSIIECRSGSKLQSLKVRVYIDWLYCVFRGWRIEERPTHQQKIPIPYLSPDTPEGSSLPTQLCVLNRFLLVGFAPFNLSSTPKEHQRSSWTCQ